MGIVQGLMMSYGGSNLTQIFDFSTNDRKGYSRGNDAGSGWVIDTTNKYVVSGGIRGNGQAYKTLGATKIHSRIKFSMVNTSIAGNRGGVVYSMPAFGPINATEQYGAYYLAQGGDMKLGISVYGVNTSKYVATTLGNDYYLDFIANDGVFTSILLNSSLVEIDRISATNFTNKVVPYEGFCAREHSATGHFYKIKGYRKG